MTGHRWGKRSIQRMKYVHPNLIAVATLALRVFMVDDCTVIEGARTEAQQRINVEKKVSKTMNSTHLIQKDGFSHAIDLGPLIDSKIPWDDNNFKHPQNPWVQQANAMKKAAALLGVDIVCGVDWGWDGPHYELA